jgi:hypothetical protein
MSRISISGIKDPQRRKLIRVATHSMLEALVGKRLYLEIAIKFVPLMLQEGNMGSCELEDDDLVNPRLFNILIDDKLKGGEVLITLAHELVHVRQYAKGDLYQYQKTNHVRWRREKMCVQNLTYSEYPWEKEAFSLQNEVAVDFIQSYKEPEKLLAFLIN